MELVAEEDGQILLRILKDDGVGVQAEVYLDVPGLKRALGEIDE